jgi:radical SAM protein with 4Fe4S-binding SPASM domain
MVLTQKNFDDVIPLAKLAVNLGIDYLVVKACSDTPDGSLAAPSSEYLDLKSVFEQAENLSNDRTKIIIRWEKLGNLGNKSYKTCYGTRFIIAISGNGNVFPCGHWFDIEKDRFQMGNVNDLPLGEILNSDKYKNSQNEVLKVDLRNCETNCRQHQINLFLDKLDNQNNKLQLIEQMGGDREPKHVNFV